MRKRKVLRSISAAVASAAAISQLLGRSTAETTFTPDFSTSMGLNQGEYRDAGLSPQSLA